MSCIIVLEIMRYKIDINPMCNMIMNSKSIDDVASEKILDVLCININITNLNLLKNLL